MINENKNYCLSVINKMFVFKFKWQKLKRSSKAKGNMINEALVIGHA